MLAREKVWWWRVVMVKNLKKAMWGRTVMVKGSGEVYSDKENVVMKRYSRAECGGKKMVKKGHSLE
jgi:hypothetical protein